MDDISTFSLTGKAQNLEQIRMHWNAIESIRWGGSSWLSVEKENIARKLFNLS